MPRPSPSERPAPPRERAQPGPGGSRPGEQLLRAAYAAARLAHGDLGLTCEEFADDALALARARRRALGLSEEPAALAEALAARALCDLVLARAAERGSERAWELVCRGYRARLAGLAIQRGLGAADAEGAADDLLSSLALAPGDGRARTRLGTFDGSGSLWGWLAAGLVHALAKRGRDRSRPLEPAVAEALPARDPRPGEPEQEAEEARALHGALARGWARLERVERCALVWKHHHGLSQRHVALLLGLREDNISRQLARALAKLRGAVEEAFPPGASLASRDAEALIAILRDHLARSAALEPPPAEPGTRPLES